MKLPKPFLGRLLYEVSDHLPSARPWLARWGLRTRQEWFEGEVPVVRSRRTGQHLRLPSFGANYLSFELFWRGLDYYEPLTTALAVMLTEPTGLFIDAGANIGYHSLRLAASRPGLDIVAFEPNPRMHALLQANIQANHFDRIVAEPLALSDREGILPFYLNRSDMSSSLERGFDGNHSGVVSVPITSLDQYLAHRGGVTQPLLIKVDVEGHEPAFFAGAERTLRLFRPDIIAEAAVPYPIETIALLHRCGYRFRQITDEGLRPCEEPAAYLRDGLVFLNCLLTTRPVAELASISVALQAAARGLDLYQTSKRADHRVLARCREQQAAPRAAAPRRALAGLSARSPGPQMR
jgi:FkbM family methyltransferase